MRSFPTKLSACAIAAAALLSACGGGGTTTDTTAPTVTITDNVSATATGDVTFTFTFSEAVTGFTVDDITVTGGAKGTFTMASTGLSATLVVSPTANSSGTINVNVAASKFADIAGLTNTTEATATQAFNTVTTPTPTPSANLVTNGNFSSGNTGWTGNALNVLTEGGNSYNSANVTAAGNPWDVNLSFPLSIPNSNVKYKLRFKAQSDRARTLIAGIGLASDPWTNTVQTVTLTTNLQTFELSLTSNFASTNSRVIFDMGAAAGAVSIDDVELVLDTSIVDTPTSSGVLSLSTGFASKTLSASGGAITNSGGSNFDNYNCTGGAAVCGGDAGGAGADSFAYFYYQTTTPATGLYSQIEIFGPNVTGLKTDGDTGGVTIGSQTKVNFNFNPNPQWFNSGAPKMGVVLTLGKRYAIGGGCHIQLHGVKNITSEGSTAYSMNLRDDFRVAQDCGTGIAPDNVNAALAASPVVSSFKVLGAGGTAAIEGRGGLKSTANLSVKTGDVYPTTVALRGAITFD
jgi:hypothetical protein